MDEDVTNSHEEIIITPVDLSGDSLDGDGRSKWPPSMKKLVSPEHIVYFVNSRNELKELVRRLRIDEKLAGNLRQLCGWQEVSDGHSGRGLASGWTLLHLVRWLRRDGMDTYIVAIGTAPQIRKAVPGLKEVTSSDDQLKKLLNG